MYNINNKLKIKQNINYNNNIKNKENINYNYKE